MMETIGTVLDRIEAQQAMSLQLKPDAISLDLLQAVYRNNQLGTSNNTRFRRFLP